MLFMNEYEIEDALQRVQPDTEPVLALAVIALANLAAWTNDNSDGWAYWPLPCRAAKGLQQAIQDHQTWERTSHFKGAEITAAAVKKALTPIKAFLTKRGVDHEVLVSYAYRLVAAS